MGTILHSYNLHTSLRYSAMIRNWITITEFLTMAAIAVNRLVGCLLFNYKMNNAANVLFDPKVTSYACVGIWTLAFIILSPFTFSITIGSYQVGTFGYDQEFGKCDTLCYVDQIEFPQKLKFRKNHYLRIKINCRVI